MTDEETAKYWQAKNAKVVVIKHGMKGSTAYLNNGESYSIKPFPVKSNSCLDPIMMSASFEQLNSK